MAMKFRKNKQGKAHPIFPKTFVQPKQSQSKTGYVRTLTVSEARDASSQLLYNFNATNNRETKVQIKRQVVQIANLARAMSRSRNYEMEARSKFADIADEYDKAKNQMVLPITSKQKMKTKMVRKSLQSRYRVE